MDTFTEETRAAQLVAARAYLDAPCELGRLEALVRLEALCWAKGDTRRDTALRIVRRLREVERHDDS